MNDEQVFCYFLPVVFLRGVLKSDPGLYETAIPLKVWKRLQKTAGFFLKTLPATDDQQRHWTLIVKGEVPYDMDLEVETKSLLAKL